jgi:hypothetical protein
LSQPPTAKAVRNRYLLKRANYIYRRVVPPKFRPIVGKRAWWITLSVDNKFDALLEVSRLAKVHDAALRQLRALSDTALLRLEIAKLRETLRSAEIPGAIAKALPSLPSPLREAIDCEGGPSKTIDKIDVNVMARATVAQFPEGSAAFVLPDDLHTLPVEEMRNELVEHAEWQQIWTSARDDNARLRPIISALGLGSEKTPLTVSDMAEAWFEAVPRRSNTVQRLRMTVKRFTDTAGDLPAARVTPLLVAEFFDQVARLPDPTGTPPGMREAPMPDLLAWAAENPDHPRILASSFNT